MDGINTTIALRKVQLKAGLSGNLLTMNHILHLQSGGETKLCLLLTYDLGLQLTINHVTKDSFTIEGHGDKIHDEWIKYFQFNTKTLFPFSTAADGNDVDAVADGVAHNGTTDDSDILSNDSYNTEKEVNDLNLDVDYCILVNDLNLQDYLDFDYCYSVNELELINNYLKINPNFELVNRKLIPVSYSPIAIDAVVHEISRQLGNWNIKTKKDGLGVVTTSKGGFDFNVTNLQKIRAPDVAFIPEGTFLSLDEKQLCPIKKENSEFVLKSMEN
ncbi:hypothetical protein RhiirB3_429089, partial [Rhizophagus irregularis]